MRLARKVQVDCDVIPKRVNAEPTTFLVLLKVCNNLVVYPFKSDAFATVSSISDWFLNFNPTIANSSDIIHRNSKLKLWSIPFDQRQTSLHFIASCVWYSMEKLAGNLLRGLLNYQLSQHSSYTLLSAGWENWGQNTWGLKG